jgi:excisionase family DNA binding protein
MPTKATATVKFYTVDDVAEFLKVDKRTVHRWTHSGLLVAHRIGGVLRISEDDFRAFLALHRRA